MAEPLIRVAALRLQSPDMSRTILDIPELGVSRGEAVALTGPSGAGKTSLLSVLAGLIKPSDGEVHCAGAPLHRLDGNGLAVWRRRGAGLVFQAPHLIPELTALENVLLPLRFDRFRVGAALQSRSRMLLEGFAVDASRKAGVMSRGEQQRVALARALLQAPPLMLADEPTASLDQQTGAIVIRYVLRHIRETGATLIVATHDPVLKGVCDRVIELEGGKMVVRP